MHQILFCSTNINVILLGGWHILISARCYKVLLIDGTQSHLDFYCNGSVCKKFQYATSLGMLSSADVYCMTDCRKMGVCVSVPLYDLIPHSMHDAPAV